MSDGPLKESYYQQRFQSGRLFQSRRLFPVEEYNRPRQAWLMMLQPTKNGVIEIIFPFDHIIDFIFHIRLHLLLDRVCVNRVFKSSIREEIFGGFMNVAFQISLLESESWQNLICDVRCISLSMQLMSVYFSITFLIFILFAINSTPFKRNLVSSLHKIHKHSGFKMESRHATNLTREKEEFAKAKLAAKPPPRHHQHIIHKHQTPDERQMFTSRGRRKRSDKDSEDIQPYFDSLVSDDKHISIFGSPCVYEGHLRTNKSWFGYLANVSVKVTGQMTFELAYPAHMCCQNILFYLEEQVVVIGQRMNCWQREFMLRPEDDQILRLTPSFPWSGCHETTDHNDKRIFLCKGGRSFSVDPSSNKLTTWFLAVSNCVSSKGLDLSYRFKIYGHVGECGQKNNPSNHSSQVTDNFSKESNLPYSMTFDSEQNQNVIAAKASLTPRQANNAQSGGQVDEDSSSCTYVGSVNTTNKWYGFIRNLTLKSGGGFKYMFTQPLSMQFQNVILYRDEDIAKLDWEMTCWQKEGVISSPMVAYQIMDMTFRSTWTGCETVESEHTRNLTCAGQKKFETPQKIYMSLSNCRSLRGLLLYYRLQVFGHDGPCSDCPALFVRNLFLYFFIVRLVVCVVRTFVSLNFCCCCSCC